MVRAGTLAAGRLGSVSWLRLFSTTIDQQRFGDRRGSTIADRNCGARRLPEVKATGAMRGRRSRLLTERWIRARFGVDSCWQNRVDCYGNLHLLSPHSHAMERNIRPCSHSPFHLDLHLICSACGSESSLEVP